MQPPASPQASDSQVKKNKRSLSRCYEAEDASMRSGCDQIDFIRRNILATSMRAGTRLYSDSKGRGEIVEFGFQENWLEGEDGEWTKLRTFVATRDLILIDLRSTAYEPVQPADDPSPELFFGRFRNIDEELCEVLRSNGIQECIATLRRLNIKGLGVYFDGVVTNAGIVHVFGITGRVQLVEEDSRQRQRSWLTRNKPAHGLEHLNEIVLLRMFRLPRTQSEARIRAVEWNEGCTHAKPIGDKSYEWVSDYMLEKFEENISTL